MYLCIQISVNLKNFRFWDQTCPKKINEKEFEKMNKKIVVNL